MIDKLNKELNSKIVTNVSRIKLIFKIIYLQIMASNSVYMIFQVKIVKKIIKNKSNMSQKATGQMK